MAMDFVPDLLQGLPEAEAQGVMALGRSRTLRGGEVLFPLGSDANHLFVVRRGRIVLSLPLRIQDGAKDVFVEERQPGNTVGWSALVPPHRFTLTATATTDAEVIAFAQADLVELFEARPAIGLAVMTNLARVVGGRLQAFQALWLREFQRRVDQRMGQSPGT
jgi:CRP-like cAMP-binding protein